VKSEFWKVISARQLQRWEKQIHTGGSRKEKLRQIKTKSAYILDKFAKTICKKAIIHHIHITQWACATTKKLIRFQSITRID